MAEEAPSNAVSLSSTTDNKESLTQLASLKAAATKEYSLRNYAAAADLYSEATELQTELNGEMSPENADLLYAYGRCLYHVAVSKSDVLGGKVASEEPKKKKRKTASTSNGDALKNGEEKTAEEIVEAAVEDKNGALKKEADTDSKPFFQITGDENWTDDEDEDEDPEAQDGEPEDEEEEDDFAIAYEILDVARVLLTRKLETLEQTAQDAAGKGKAAATDTPSPSSRAVMERLADTHDLQAEISLENERFSDAVTDSRSALDLKLKLFPKESSLVAEAHFKLSLALEFASVTTIQAEGEALPEDQEPATQVDEEARKEAAVQMEEAIESCRLRVVKEKSVLASLAVDQKSDKEKSIRDVEEMVADMEQRLLDLRNPAVAVNGATGPAGAPDGSNPLGGLLGSILGESTAEQKSRIAEATKGANDLTGLIRKKQPKTETKEAVVPLGNGSGKRKLEENGEVGAKTNGKKVKFEDGPAA